MLSGKLRSGQRSTLSCCCLLAFALHPSTLTLPSTLYTLYFYTLPSLLTNRSPNPNLEWQEEERLGQSVKQLKLKLQEAEKEIGIYQQGHLVAEAEAISSLASQPEPPSQPACRPGGRCPIRDGRGSGAEG